MDRRYAGLYGPTVFSALSRNDSSSTSLDFDGVVVDEFVLPVKGEVGGEARLVDPPVGVAAAGYDLGVELLVLVACLLHQDVDQFGRVRTGEMPVLQGAVVEPHGLQIRDHEAVGDLAPLLDELVAVEHHRDGLARIEFLGRDAHADAALAAKGIERFRHRRRVDRAVLHRRHHFRKAHVVHMHGVVIGQAALDQRLVDRRTGRCALAGFGAAQPFQIGQRLVLPAVDQRFADQQRHVLVTRQIRALVGDDLDLDAAIGAVEKAAEVAPAPMSSSPAPSGAIM